jgi:hypothetical protein
MKSLLKISSFALLFFVAFAATGFVVSQKPVQADLTGAWQLQDESNEGILLFMNGYFSYTSFNKMSRQFKATMGGTYKVVNGQVMATFEFCSDNKEIVGQTMPYSISLANDILTVKDELFNARFKRLDNGNSPLAGVWRITGRMQEGKVVPVHQTGTRKTVKILTGNRFQWVAMDTGTKEFSGTGGGTYTFADGKYTETIEFFSRDNSRVGATLTFDGKLEKDGWHHSGLSSRGDKIYEIWNKVK